MLDIALVTGTRSGCIGGLGRVASPLEGAGETCLKWAEALETEKMKSAFVDPSKRAYPRKDRPGRTADISTERIESSQEHEKHFAEGSGAARA